MPSEVRLVATAVAYVVMDLVVRRAIVIVNTHTALIVCNQHVVMDLVVQGR